MDINDMSIYDWLDFFAANSNHSVLNCWRNNKKIFFYRFMVIGDKELFIIGDKSNKKLYEFKKPNVVQLNWHNI